MSTCPHCGEYIEDAAESCPHCGSDYETGWNPDADYHSLDLPSFDDEDDEHFADPYSFGSGSSEGSSAGGRRDGPGAPYSLGVGATIGSTIVLIISLGLVAAAGFPVYGWAIFGPVALLAVCAVYFRRMMKRPPGSNTSPR